MKFGSIQRKEERTKTRLESKQVIGRYSIRHLILITISVDRQHIARISLFLYFDSFFFLIKIRPLEFRKLPRVGSDPQTQTFYSRDLSIATQTLMYHFKLSDLGLRHKISLVDIWV